VPELEKDPKGAFESRANTKPPKIIRAHKRSSALLAVTFPSRSIDNGSAAPDLVLFRRTHCSHNANRLLAKAAGIKVEGNDKWLMMMQNTGKARTQT
jgi:hypothetical protein